MKTKLAFAAALTMAFSACKEPEGARYPVSRSETVIVPTDSAATDKPAACCAHPAKDSTVVKTTSKP